MVLFRVPGGGVIQGPGWGWCYSVSWVGVVLFRVPGGGVVLFRVPGGGGVIQGPGWGGVIQGPGPGGVIQGPGPGGLPDRDGEVGREGTLTSSPDGFMRKFRLIPAGRKAQRRRQRWSQQTHEAPAPHLYYRLLVQGLACPPSWSSSSCSSSSCDLVAVFTTSLKFHHYALIISSINNN